MPLPPSFSDPHAIFFRFCHRHRLSHFPAFIPYCFPAFPASPYRLYRRCHAATQRFLYRRHFSTFCYTTFTPSPLYRRHFSSPPHLFTDVIHLHPTSPPALSHAVPAIFIAISASLRRDATTTTASLITCFLPLKDFHSNNFNFPLRRPNFAPTPMPTRVHTHQQHAETDAVANVIIGRRIVILLSGIG